MTISGQTIRMALFFGLVIWEILENPQILEDALDRLDD